MAAHTSTTAQLKQFWESRSSRQKALLIGGAVATGVLVVLFVRLIGSPDYKQLSTGMEAADVQALVAKLDQAGITPPGQP